MSAVCLPFHFLHQLRLNTPSYVHATNPTAMQRKLKMTPTTPPTIAGNASKAFPISILWAPASLFNQPFFQSSFIFWGE